MPSAPEQPSGLRESLTKNWQFVRGLTLSQWAPIVVLSVGLFEPIINWRKDKDFWSVAWVTFTAIAFVVSALQVLSVLRNTDNYHTGLDKGAKDTFDKWESYALAMEAAQNANMRAYRQKRNQRGQEAESRFMADHLLVAIMEVVYAVYSLPPRSLTATLGLPNAEGTQFCIMTIVPEARDRHKGGVYPVPEDPSKAHSMIEAYLSRKLVYTHDAHRFEELQDKEYRSILSFPVLDEERNVLAVVNIDTPKVCAFGEYFAESTKLDQKLVFLLALSPLRALARLLMEGNTYRTPPTGRA